MKRNIFSPPTLACALTALVLAGLMLGPFMRETDQAWLLDGGLGIATGHPEIARADFNFDKQFVSYYLPALVLKLLPHPVAADTLVFATNLLGLLLFWGGLIWLLARSSRRLSLALALPVILVPSFLVYSPFYASAFISAAFVIFLAAFLDRSKWGVLQRALVFVLAFGAVGARADAMFLLPLLAMLHSPRRTFVSVLKSPNTWLMASGGVAAFLVGRALYLEHINDFWGIPFRLKAYLGYLAFGLGGAGLVLLAALHAIWSARRAAHCRLWLAFLGLGLAMPITYYSFQLAGPRHCTVAAISILVFVCAPAGRSIFQIYFRPKTFAAIAKPVLLAGALGPVLLGLNLADLHHPKLTFTQPTVLPSVAGVAPFGAYLGFALGVRRDQGFLDHNHAVWVAAKSTHFENDASGKVPYLFTPIESYLRLAIRLQGKIPGRGNFGEANWPPPFFYVESRSLMRFQFVFPPESVSLEKFLATTMLTPATAATWQGITIFRGEPAATVATESPSASLWALNTRFGPDEFRRAPVSALAKIPADWAGKKLVLVSQSDFTVSGDRARQKELLSSPAFGSWHVCEISRLRADETITLQATSPENIFVGISVFPEWMSVQKM